MRLASPLTSGNIPDRNLLSLDAAVASELRYRLRQLEVVERFQALVEAELEGLGS